MGGKTEREGKGTVRKAWSFVQRYRQAIQERDRQRLQDTFREHFGLGIQTARTALTHPGEGAQILKDSLGEVRDFAGQGVEAAHETIREVSANIRQGIQTVSDQARSALEHSREAVEAVAIKIEERILSGAQSDVAQYLDHPELDVLNRLGIPQDDPQYPELKQHIHNLLVAGYVRDVGPEVLQNAINQLRNLHTARKGAVPPSHQLPSANTVHEDRQLEVTGRGQSGSWVSELIRFAISNPELAGIGGLEIAKLALPLFSRRVDSRAEAVAGEGLTPRQKKALLDFRREVLAVWVELYRNGENLTSDAARERLAPIYEKYRGQIHEPIGDTNRPIVDAD